MTIQNRKCESCGELFTFKVRLDPSKGVATQGPWKCPKCIDKAPEPTSPMGRGFVRRVVRQLKGVR